MAARLPCRNALVGLVTERWLRVFHYVKRGMFQSVHDLMVSGTGTVAGGWTRAALLLRSGRRPNAEYAGLRRQQYLLLSTPL